ncbi:13853_t:CDS:2 [Dentiscutata erythropus]|uniref:13853_t:CDS:1 n=1 Tax=Dentiscutata erythropus TaxID=1348616 RepID=A0A9N9DE69_9GLOM|nr:13853_t:CDS:2 [Dentiscutata erythropus]
MTLVKALSENNNTLSTLDLRNNYFDHDMLNDLVKALGKNAHNNM